MRRAAVLLAVLIAVETAAQEEPAVRVILEPPVVPFHQQAVFTIEVEYAGELRPELPSMVGRFGGLSVYRMPDYTIELIHGGRLRVRESYILDPVFPGDYVIEPVTVTVGEEQKITVSSPMLRVRELTEAEIEEAALFDATLPGLPDSAIREWWQRWELWAAAGVIAAAVLAAAYVLFRPRPVRTVAAPPKTPWEVALDRLRVLDERGLIAAGKHGPYYVDLSSILRYYIEGRFELHAPERTTPEFLEEAAQHALFSADQEAFLGALLRHCDRVKFAQYRPAREEMERSFGEVADFVNETIPEAEPELAEAAV